MEPLSPPPSTLILPILKKSCPEDSLVFSILETPCIEDLRPQPPLPILESSCSEDPPLPPFPLRSSSPSMRCTALRTPLLHPRGVVP